MRIGDRELHRSSARVGVHKIPAWLALTALLTLALFGAPGSTSGAAPKRMTPVQVADFALKCAIHNNGAKVTTYYDIKCAAEHSSDITVSSGVVGAPTDYPAYSSIGFLYDSLTKMYTCFAYPDKVGASPVNITSNCPLWIIPSEYATTNYASAWSIATAFPTSADPSLPTLTQLQSAAASANGTPSVTTGSGRFFIHTITPESTFRMSYSSGIGLDWCLWFYQGSGTGDQPQTRSLISPPGMYGTC
jgi:hypothetical protein